MAFEMFCSISIGSFYVGCFGVGVLSDSSSEMTVRGGPAETKRNPPSGLETALEIGSFVYK